MATVLTLTLDTALGPLRLRLLPRSAPQTVAHVVRLVRSGAYDGAAFYRSDFALQFGLHPNPNPHGDLSVNETGAGEFVSNARGTASVAHFDAPDCGGSELFVNLTDNPHLDAAYGGYCVFARVEDAGSFAVVDRVAGAVKREGRVVIRRATISE